METELCVPGVLENAFFMKFCKIPSKVFLPESLSNYFCKKLHHKCPTLRVLDMLLLQKQNDFRDFLTTPYQSCNMEI